MFFKPSAAKVAKRIYKKAPSMAATISIALGDDYAATSDEFESDETFTSILIDITAESLIRGIAEVRGEGFGIKVGREYNRLAPTLGALADACAQAAAAGWSEERGMAELVAGGDYPHHSEQLVTRLEQYFAAFRQEASDVLALAQTLRAS